MRLRNKKTGEIKKAEAREDGIYLWDEQTKHWWIYELDMLASGWEYYVEPKEPLIKDEKIRKAVRVWAGYNCDKEVIYFVDGDGSSKLMSYRFEIDFFNEVGELKDGEHYTIDELCGEEEE